MATTSNKTTANKTTPNKTKKPTGLSISRNGNTYTFKWKIAAKNHGGGQTLQYSVNGGAWTAKSVGAAATETSVTASFVARIRFRVRGKRKKEKDTTYAVSDWAECLWTATVPPVPSLSYSNAGTNKGTFTWSTASSATGTAVATGVQSQTVYERHAGASSFGTAPALLKAVSGSELIVEDSTTFAGGRNIVRWFRVRSYGPGGFSAWKTVSHAYGAPRKAQITSAKGTPAGSLTSLDVSWQIVYDAQFPVDTIKLQYAVAVPTDVQMTPPASGWSDAIELSVKGVKDRVVTSVPAHVDMDECMWVRVATVHDGLTAYSSCAVAKYGKLEKPTIDAVPNVSTGSVSITITEETSCEAAQTAILVRPEGNPSRDRVVAVLPRGTTTTTLTVPEIIGATRTCFIAYAFVGLAYGSTSTGYRFESVRMTSDWEMDSDIPSVAPADVTVEEGPDDNSARLSWAWSWQTATKAELSWADSEYAWESTNEPSKYEIKDGPVTTWIVAGLEPDKTWHFRVRLIDGSGDEDVIGPWSDIVSFGSTSTPNRPVLRLSKTVINEGDTIVARWLYVSSGDATQDYAEICLVTYDNNNELVYGDVIARTEQEQSVEISQDWETNETYNLAVRVTSTNGNQSEWSEPVSLFVAPPAVITLVSSNLGISRGQTVGWEIDTLTTRIIGDSIEYTAGSTSGIYEWTGCKRDFEDYLFGQYSSTNTTTDEEETTIVTETHTFEYHGSPSCASHDIQIYITGAGTSGTTMVSIVRAEDYKIDRPDGSNNDGYDGETVLVHSQIGEDVISLGIDDFIRPLDNGCKYFLVGKIIDEYGQSASFEYPFWAILLQIAHMPVADVQIDPYQRIAIITPMFEDGADRSGIFDIYRLSADGPELILSGADVNEQYVDPYPTIGQHGGHRIVNIEGGNYLTSGGQLAWYDTDASDGDILDEDSMIIDVDGQQIVLPYNIELSNKWGKDFKRTSYLGGSIQGDWNPAVTRDITANTVLVRSDDLDGQIAMRNLAGYAGIAHVRTPDGSSITCNVQIDENQSYDTRKVSYTLTMQAIDSGEPEGMTLAEWEELHPVGE